MDVADTILDFITQVVAGDIVDLHLLAIVMHRNGYAEIARVVDRVDLARDVLDDAPVAGAECRADDLPDLGLADVGRHRYGLRIDQRHLPERHQQQQRRRQRQRKPQPRVTDTQHELPSLCNVAAGRRAASVRDRSHARGRARQRQRRHAYTGQPSLPPKYRMPARIEPLAVTARSVTSALGHGIAAHLEALSHGQGGLRANDFSSAALDCFIGRVDGIEQAALPGELAHWDCRNNRLAWLGLQQDGVRQALAGALARYGPDRVALVLGTSTASIESTEQAYRRLDDGRFPADLRRPEIHTPHSLAAFVADATGIAGPALTISTACSSSAKVFGSAERLMRLGLADAVLVGGVDTLCDSVLFGFRSLELVSQHPCRPFDLRRDG